VPPTAPPPPAALPPLPPEALPPTLSPAFPAFVPLEPALGDVPEEPPFVVPLTAPAMPPEPPVVAPEGAVSEQPSTVMQPALQNETTKSREGIIEGVRGFGRSRRKEVVGVSDFRSRKERGFPLLPKYSSCCARVSRAMKRLSADDAG
jgi:hypothetical protein